MVRRIVLASFWGFSACACGPSQSGTEDSSGEVADVPSDVPADLPTWDECEDATGTRLNASDVEWALFGESGHVFEVAMLDSDAGYLKAVDAADPSQFQLLQTDLSTGEVLGTSSVEADRGGSFARHPSGDLLHFSSDGHDITVRRFEGVELTDATTLLGDHPKVGWDGGRSAITLVDPREQDFTILGRSIGMVDPEASHDVERHWRKRYNYGVAGAHTVDYVLGQQDAEIVWGAAWVEEDVVLGVGGVTRVDEFGSNVWQAGMVDPFLLDSRGARSIWRTREPTNFAGGGETNVLRRLTAEEVPGVETLWVDRHCSERWLNAGSYVKAGDEFVFVSDSRTDDDSVVVHMYRLDMATNTEVEVFEYERDTGSYQYSVFETKAGRTGILFHGVKSLDADTFQAHAFAMFPFG